MPSFLLFNKDEHKVNLKTDVELKIPKSQNNNNNSNQNYKFVGYIFSSMKVQELRI